MPCRKRCAASRGNWTLADFDGDEMLAAEAGRFDLAVSMFSLQAINDLPGALMQIRRALKPDGLFLAALFGGATLTRIARQLRASRKRNPGRHQPAGFALRRCARSGRAAAARRLCPAGHRCRAHDGALWRFFRAWCATCAPMARPMRWPNAAANFLRRDTLAALLAHYARPSCARTDKLNATFEIVYLTGWAPHDSQQQPLKPGSAKARPGRCAGHGGTYRR